MPTVISAKVEVCAAVNEDFAALATGIILSSSVWFVTKVSAFTDYLRSLFWDFFFFINDLIFFLCTPPGPPLFMSFHLLLEMLLWLLIFFSANNLLHNFFAPNGSY